MNFVFAGILMASFLTLLVYNPDMLLSSLLSGAGDGLSFAFKLFAIYGVWLSILRLWDKMGFDAFLGRKMKGALRKIFPGESEVCYNYLSVNLSANMLGMGSAGTPAGIYAVENMKRKKNRVMLIVVNSSSVQLLPTTMIAMRSAAGAASDIILPSIIATFASTFLGFLAVEFLVK